MWHCYIVMCYGILRYILEVSLRYLILYCIIHVPYHISFHVVSCHVIYHIIYHIYNFNRRVLRDTIQKFNVKRKEVPSAPQLIPVVGAAHFQNGPKINRLCVQEIVNSDLSSLVGWRCACAFKIPVKDDIIQSGWKIVALFGRILERHQLDFPGMLATGGRCDDDDNDNDNNNNKSNNVSRNWNLCKRRVGIEFCSEYSFLPLSVLYIDLVLPFTQAYVQQDWLNIHCYHYIVFVLIIGRSYMTISSCSFTLVDLVSLLRSKSYICPF